MTTAATLSSVEGSFLWKLVTAQQQSAAAPRASLSGEFFIDRNGKVTSPDTVPAVLCIAFLRIACGTLRRCL